MIVNNTYVHVKNLSDISKCLVETGGYGNENAEKLAGFVGDLNVWWHNFADEPIQRCFVVTKVPIPRTTAQQTMIVAHSNKVSVSKSRISDTMTASEFKQLSRTGGKRRRVMKSAAARAADEYWTIVALDVMSTVDYEPLFPSNCPIGFTALFAWHSNVVSKAKTYCLKSTAPDGDNMIKMVQDAFAKNGLCMRDSQIQQVPIRLHVCGTSFMYFEMARLRSTI